MARAEVTGWCPFEDRAPRTDDELFAPTPQAKAAIFYSFAEGEARDQYYDSQTMASMRHSQTPLAYEMNYHPLTEVHGAPLRLRVENQLGYKMVKWISAIEFAEDYRHVYQGTGDYQEDHDFFDTRADI